MKILVFGGGGQVGREVCRAARPGSVELVTCDQRESDITEPVAVAAAVSRHRPDLVINLAAYTAVDRAESEPEAAWAVNCAGAANIAAVCGETATPLIHVSTDYVFDGASERPYTEEDPTNPLNVYGRSKLEGEMRVCEACPSAIVLRTSWVFSPYGSNFVRTMLRLAQTQEIARVVDDQCGAPTAAADLAEAILEMVVELDGTPGRPGVYHVTAAGATTWHGFAAAIFARLPGAVRACNLVAIKTSEYPRPACRPRNSRLDCTKMERTFGIRLPDWEHSLEACLQQITEIERC